jgi:hypothetical protein
MRMEDMIQEFMSVYIWDDMQFWQLMIYYGMKELQWRLKYLQVNNNKKTYCIAWFRYVAL